MTTLHDFTLTTIDGHEKNLAAYRDKAVLLVNVASRCGLTPQYKALEALHREFADKGLVVAGIPANDFGAQEPGTDAEIQQFCSSKYDVSFPMFSKLSVKGDTKHPLYRWLTESEGRAELELREVPGGQRRSRARAIRADRRTVGKRTARSHRTRARLIAATSPWPAACDEGPSFGFHRSSSALVCRVEPDTRIASHGVVPDVTPIVRHAGHRNHRHRVSGGLRRVRHAE